MPDRPAGPHASAPLRIAAGCSWVLGLGFGLPCAYGIWYFAQQGEVWTFLGLPTYGHGPLDDFGIHTSVGLLAAFLLVCGAELCDGWLLWRGRASGSILALALLPFEFVFWWGFALPVGPLLGLARAALVSLAWARHERPDIAPRAPETAG